MTLQSSRFTYVNAARYVIVVDTPVGDRKLIQILCTAKDGGIYVAFPYAQLGPGTLGIARIEPGPELPRTVEVGHDFPATVHTIKYSHHPSGQAHFSLDGKVNTVVKRNAVPLDAVNGHLFTVKLQGFSHFKATAKNERASQERAVATLSLTNSALPAVKLVGWLYSEDRIPLGSLTELSGQRGYAVRNREGTLLHGVLLLTSLRAKGKRWFLLVTAESVPSINTQGEAFMDFMGGFDHEDVALDHSLSLECLMFFYPYRGDLGEAVARNGTIDRTCP